MRSLSYETARIVMKAGDSVGFGAGGFVSWMIRLWTRSALSHWSVIFTVSPDEAQWLTENGIKGCPYLEKPQKERAGDRIVLIESTMLNDKKGVQVNWASERIEHYDGLAWWFELHPQYRSKLDYGRFKAFGLKCLGLPYDKVLILHDLFDPLGWIPSRENWNAMICSEFGAAIYKESGVIPTNINSSDQTPQSMAEFAMWSGVYQLKGKSKEIRNFSKVII
jgi:hypothetical protein